MSSLRLRLALALSLIGILVCGAGCAAQEPWDATLRRIAAPYRFSFASWELAQFAGRLQPVAWPPEALRDPAAYVRDYLARQAQANALEREGQPVPPALQEELARMRPVAEGILAEQVADAYRQEGIVSPLDRYLRAPVAFPPVWFVIEPPPNLLVVSPRQRIEPIRQVMLVSGLDAQAAEAIEAQVEALGLSALVTEIGGLGATYPAVVSTRSSLAYTIETVAEEWLHQYLAFTPLGFRYILHLLRLQPDYEIAQINESLATIVHQEIGERVLAEEYGILPAPEPAPTEEDQAFDFRAFMHETRLQAEALLAQGEIEAAEAYMEDRRTILVAQGYRIRKLNQAYFAFHGTYAEAPGAVTPVGAELRTLRAQFPLLGAFLNVASGLTSRQELRQLLEAYGIRSAGLAPTRRPPITQLYG